MMMNLQLRLSLSVFFIALFSLLFLNTSIAQVSYNSAASYSLRKTVSTYTGNAIQVRRDCDNATTNIGFTACGDLDTTALRNFVLVPNPLSAITPAAQGAYSLRKLRCAYSGNAINVRRSCDNAARDIGFTSTGDLDTVALKAFVMASNPISALSVNANVAYSLRRLRCAYVGPAIRVRSTAVGTPTADIGFTTNGDLDTTALKTFVGVGNSGFVTIWYDQSGNGINVSPPALANQPRIINAGVVERRNGVPTLFFDGTTDYFTTNSFSTTGYSGFTANVIASWTTGGGIRVLIDNNHDCSRGFVFQDRNDLASRPLEMAVPPNGACNSVKDIITTGNGSLRILSYVNNTTSETGYRDGTTYATQAYAGAYVIQTRFMIGAWNSGPSRFFSGQMSEVILFKSALSNTDRQYLEWGQSQYYNVSGPTLSSTLPAGAPSAFVATWYDQSGNARNATQATAGLQPRIINAGLIEKNASNRPTIFFNGTYLKNTFFLTTQPVSTSCVWRARGLANPGGELFGWGDNGGGGRRYGAWFAFNSATQGRYGVENLGAGTVGSSLLNTNTWYISSQILPGTSLPALTQWINGTSQAMTNIGAPAAMNITAGEFAIGTIPTANTQGHNGDIQELVYFSSALSATDRQYIEYGQSVYYRITGPSVPPALPVTPPSAYVSIWYDQSGNGRNATQPAIGNQPKIINSGVMSLQNGKPAISLDGTSTWLIQSTMNVTQPYSLNTIATRTVNGGCCGGYQRLVNISSTGDAFGYLGVLAGNYATFNGNGVATWNDIAACTPATGIALNSQAIMTMVSATGATGLIPSANGTALTLKNGTSAAGTGFLLGGAYSTNNTSQLWPGNISEFHIFSSALSTTRRNLLETNQASYYARIISNNKYTPPTSTSYIYYVNGVGRESATDSVGGTRSTGGMGVSITTAVTAFLKDNGDYLTYGMNCFATPFTSASNLPAPVLLRWTNDWYLNKTDVGSNNGLMTIFFDYSDYGAGAGPGVASNYVLLYRSSAAGTFSIVPSTTVSTAGDRVLFNVDGSNITTNYFYTIGTIDPASSPLPIELIDFNCNLINSQTVELKWTTASESNTSYFSIERSEDAVNYTSVGKINAAGNSLNTLNYSLTDEDALKNISYYRLKSVDVDGSYKFSTICSVSNDELDTNDDIHIYPNPTNSLLIINFKNNTYINTDSYSIMDISGKKIEASYSIVGNKIILDLSYLKSGLYFIELKNIAGQKTVKKIVLQK